MAIEFYSFGTPHPAGMEEHFKKELPLFMKNVNAAKVLFIHNPRISNMLMTDIDLLLIMAIENKKGNFHKINKKNIYNAVIPIHFINETICYGGVVKFFPTIKK